MHIYIRLYIYIYIYIYIYACVCDRSDNIERRPVLHVDKCGGRVEAWMWFMCPQRQIETLSVHLGWSVSCSLSLVPSPLDIGG